MSIESPDMTSYFLTIVMFALSPTIDKIKCKKCSIVNEGQGLNVRKKKNVNCAIRLEMF